MSPALKAGAGSPTLAVAAAGCAVARSRASAPIAARAATVKVFIGIRIGSLRRIDASDFSDCVEHGRLGQKLRQDLRVSLAAIEQIERDTVAAELLQETGDFRVLAGPVALEGNDAPCREGRAHRLAVERNAFVDQAGDA